MTLKHAVVIGIAAGLTAALVLSLVSLVLFFSVGGASHHEVELGPGGEPAYTIP
jgi:hypothetical protein